MLRYVLLIWLCMSFNAVSNEIDEPEIVVANFLSQMKVKDYIEASKYISDTELNWLFQVSVPLLRNPEFLGIYDLEALSQSEVKALGKSGVFELWSLLAWDARDKSFGSYQPQNILGTVREGSASAYVVVRDITHPHHEAMVYTLVLESNVWRIMLPRIIKGSVTLYERMIDSK
ncbi:hypothetical protein PRUB_a0597 [Pseudoalteromonas rubra]|uniref:Uncharacterized protein n=2 Tax=Pseudoalteromonas rubra TaxID=43658 RepID=A0A8T0C6W7_9GAMM|nr:hypothetical protein PRUB_a0597 [Pseudoalteromonas rubra]